MIIDVNNLLHLKAQLSEINKADFNDLQFYEDGKLIEVPKEWLDDWQYIGLNNTDFITSGFYKTGFDK